MDLKELSLGLCTGLICLIIYKKWRSGVAGFYEDGNEHSVFVKCEDCLQCTCSEHAHSQ
jgi:hypothetical protein